MRENKHLQPQAIALSFFARKTLANNRTGRGKDKFPIARNHARKQVNPRAAATVLKTKKKEQNSPKSLHN